MPYLGNQRRRTIAALIVVSVSVGIVGNRNEVEAGKGAGRATTKSLGGPARYLTALSTDKPIYRPGEPVLVRGVLLQAFDRTPLGEVATPTIEIKGPKGDTVAQGTTASDRGVWGFSWLIPDGQPGGAYTVRATYPGNGHAPAERKFDVRVFRAPRLKSQIVFLRDGYGPGDKVTATLDVKRAEGGVPAGAKVTATATVDGAEVARVPSVVGPEGHATVSFDLPRRIARGEGALAFAIEDGGVVETAAKTIPILLQTLDLALYPEGGDMVAGVAGRVYFEARTPAGKPADIAGAVVDGQGRSVARFRSAHEGRGRFELTPAAGARYSLRVDEPAGIKTTWPLPAAAPERVLLRAEGEAVAAGAPVRVLLASGRSQKVKVAVSQREVELGSTIVELQGGAAPRPVALPARDAAGVLVVTVLGESGTPLAERLVYRKPAPGKELTIAVRADKTAYVPGDTVRLTARATRGGKPAVAMIGFTVTDDAVLELVEKREQAPRLPAMVLLEPEVLELGDAHVYLDGGNPRAPEALDLLLGTQGWRRFAVMSMASVADFVGKHGDPARRALALRTEVRFQFDDDDGMPDPRVQNMAPRGRPAAAAIPAMPPPMPAPPPAPAPVHAPPPPVVEAPAAIAAEPPAGKVLEEKPEARSVRADDALDRAIAGKADRDEMKIIGGGARAHRAALRPQGFVVVRERAHALRPGRKASDRVDFTETLYWNTAARTDEKTGEVTVSFALSDSVTSFKVLADGFTADGALGAGTGVVESVQPFYVEPKLPLEVTAGDTIRLPVSLVNGTAAKLGARLTLTAPAALALAQPGPIGPIDLGAGARVRRLVDIAVGPMPAAAAPAEIVIDATAGPFADKVTRRLAVKPNGFPMQASFGGVTVKDGSASHAVVLPANVVAGSLRTSAAVYPTPLANMTEALARLIRDPSGCFEQTSSTTYPLTMAQQYFTSHTGVDPKLVASAKEKLDAGYKRLVAFECTDRGYEWFGENPGHEALTAYGLLHFTDMAEVRDVDPLMLSRSRDWLMKQRDGKGGFSRKRRALHTWVEDQDTSNGYILWALLESGGAGARAALGPEIAAALGAAGKSGNSYVMALGANVAALGGDKPAARRLMEKLAARQGKGGAVDGATGSIVGSGGEALAIETTSLAALAWLRDPAFAGNVERSMKYLASSCDDGRYGSTQSTVLALRAIVAYDRARARPKAPGSLRLYVDGKPVGQAAVPFGAGTEGAIKLPDFTDRLGAGPHKIEVRMQGGAPMPYTVAVDYSALTPASAGAGDCPLGLDVKLARTTAEEGTLVQADVTVTNLGKQALPTAVAIVGLPGGFEPRHDQLKELVKRGTIDAYEVLGREVVLYWRGMLAGKKNVVPLSLLAAVPGSYTGPASRAYLYYTDEHKVWIDGLRATITPKS